MRYLIFTPKLSDGGAEKVLVGYANYLSKAGHHVELVSLRDGVYSGMLNSEVKLSLLNCRLRSAVFKLGSKVRASDADVIISGMAGPNLLACLVGKFLSKKVLCSFHNDYSTLASIRNSDLGLKIFLINFLVCIMASRLIVVSKGVGQSIFMKRFFRKKIFVVHNSVDLVRKPDLTLKRNFLLAVGRLTKQKAFDRLLHAYAISEARNHFPLKIVGSGPEKRGLINLANSLGISDDVEIIDFQADIVSFYEKAKVLILSSRWEGFGNVIVEALFCGAPVVAFDVKSGPGEVLTGKDCGRLVLDGDIPGLAKAVDDFSFVDIDPRRVQKDAKEFSSSNISSCFLSAASI